MSRRLPWSRTITHDLAGFVVDIQHPSYLHTLLVEIMLIHAERINLQLSNLVW